MADNMIGYMTYAFRWTYYIRGTVEKFHSCDRWKPKVRAFRCLVGDRCNKARRHGRNMHSSIRTLESMVTMSFCAITQTLTVCTSLYILRSSAKSKHYFKTKLFIKSTDNRGPRLDPCETQELAENLPDILPLCLTINDLSSKYFFIGFNNTSNIPKVFNFWNKRFFENM